VSRDPTGAGDGSLEFIIDRAPDPQDLALLEARERGAARDFRIRQRANLGQQFVQGGGLRLLQLFGRNPSRQLGNRRFFKERGNGQLHLKRFTDARQHLRRGKRVAA